jgi:pSer/pThr/pTyr-binding forkhead associated (FHA) protein
MNLDVIMPAQLIPLDGGQALDINKDMTLIGRKEDADVRLDHKSVSKMHCVIVKTDGLLLLRDLGSTNGTRVNGQRVRRAALLPNDQVAFASFKFRVSFGPAEQLAVPSAEHTQHLDAKEVAALLGKSGAKHEDSSGEIPVLPVQVNPLPDLYEDGQQQGPAR